MTASLVQSNPSDRRPAWSTEPSEAASRLRVDPARGLSAEEVQERLQVHGLNQLREVQSPGAWRILRNQLASLIVALLALAALVAFAFGEWLDGVAIAAVLALNTLIGFVTEYRAVRSMEALRSMERVLARVRRDGRVLEIPASRLVPGDVVLIEAGDMVTADLRILVGSKLEADESALTGESVPVAKSAEPVPEETRLHDRSSMLFKGTAVTRGSAECLAFHTGMSTELGRIARLVQDAEKEATPLEKRLARLGRNLVWITLLVAALTTSLGIAAGKPVFLMVETGIALAIAAIPEGLPIVATMALARGMWRMARRHALINRLSAVETLGATSVIFTDKTGTLTENRMAVCRVAFAEGGVDVADDFHPREHGERPDLRAAIEAAVLCNNAALEGEAVGDPLEIALLRLGAAAEIHRERLIEEQPEVREVAFDTATMMMATFHADPRGFRVAVKGAPEAVLQASSSMLLEDGESRELTDADRKQWARVNDELASGGLRVLAVAQSVVSNEQQDPYANLTLLALLGLADPPRADVRSALEACHAAGLRVVMVTGDHPETAASIARAVGLVPEGEDSRVVRGSELEQWETQPKEEQERLLSASVYARVTPEQKLDLIAGYQRLGHVVAMTGDGVNDAPALRKADIGIAMGRRGTQVAREAADMVLTDDSFASIVAAVEQGRVIFESIRKFVFYLLSCNVSEVLVVSLAAAVGAPLPLLPLQILFLNLVTDVFPALALSFTEGDPDVLKRPPRNAAEPILTRRGWFRIVGYGLVISASVLGAMFLAERVLGYSRARAVTVSFLTLAITQLWHVFNTRAKGSSVFQNEITRNPWIWGAVAICITLILCSVYAPGLKTVLRTTAPSWEGWLLVAGMSLIPLVVGCFGGRAGRGP